MKIHFHPVYELYTESICRVTLTNTTKFSYCPIFLLVLFWGWDCRCSHEFSLQALLCETSIAHLCEPKARHAIWVVILAPEKGVRSVEAEKFNRKMKRIRVYIHSTNLRRHDACFKNLECEDAIQSLNWQHWVILETSQHLRNPLFGWWLHVYFAFKYFFPRGLSLNTSQYVYTLRVAPSTTAAPFQELLSLQLRESDPVIAASNGRVFFFHRSMAAWFSFATSSTEEELLLASLLGTKDLGSLVFMLVKFQDLALDFNILNGFWDILVSKQKQNNKEQIWMIFEWSSNDLRMFQADSSFRLFCPGGLWSKVCELCGE